MQLKTALLLCCIGLCLRVSAQAPDSFEQRVQQLPTYRLKLEQYLNWLQKNNLRDFDASEQRAAAALRLARRNGDSAGVGKILRYLGEANYFKGEYERAAASLYQSIQLLEAAKEPAALGHSLNALAKLYRKTRDLPRSLSHYEKALRIFRSIGDSAGAAMILNESGVVFEYAEDYPSAIARYSASLRIDEEMHDTLGQSYALSNLAGAYVLLKRFDQAEANLQQALRLRKLLRDTFALALNFSDLGELYFQAKQLQRARSYTDSSNAIAAAMEYRELQRNNFDLLARIAEAGGDNGGALVFFRRKAQLQDSLISLEKARSIEELNTKYETLRKEQTIREQQYQLTRKNFWLAVIGLLTILGAALAWSAYRRRRLQHEARMQALLMQQQEEATRAVLEAEEAERQRIAKDLHDGVGQMMSAARMNLSALLGRLPLDNPEHRATYENVISLVDDGCREVRSVSHNMMPNALLKNSLAAAVREFVDKIDHKALQVQVYAEGLDNRLDANTETVLYRVIQECVNNVIKHSGASKLDIAIVRDENEITATIEDNGRGFDTAVAGEGLGLRNIRTRIGFLKGNVEFDSRPGRGTVVAIQVPL